MYQKTWKTIKNKELENRQLIFAGIVFVTCLLISGLGNF